MPYEKLSDLPKEQVTSTAITRRRPSWRPSTAHSISTGRRAARSQLRIPPRSGRRRRIRLPRTDGGPSGPPLGGGKRDGASRPGGISAVRSPWPPPGRRKRQREVAPTEDQSRSTASQRRHRRVRAPGSNPGRIRSPPETPPRRAPGGRGDLCGWMDLQGLLEVEPPQDPVCYRCKTPRDADDITVEAPATASRRRGPSGPSPFPMLSSRCPSSSFAATHGSGYVVASSSSASCSCSPSLASPTSDTSC